MLITLPRPLELVAAKDTGIEFKDGDGRLWSSTWYPTSRAMSALAIRLDLRDGEERFETITQSDRDAIMAIIPDDARARFIGQSIAARGTS